MNFFHSSTLPIIIMQKLLHTKMPTAGQGTGNQVMLFSSWWKEYFTCDVWLCLLQCRLTYGAARLRDEFEESLKNIHGKVRPWAVEYTPI